MHFQRTKKGTTYSKFQVQIPSLYVFLFVFQVLAKRYGAMQRKRYLRMSLHTSLKRYLENYHDRERNRPVTLRFFCFGSSHRLCFTFRPNLPTIFLKA